MNRSETRFSKKDMKKRDEAKFIVKKFKDMWR